VNLVKSLRGQNSRQARDLDPALGTVRTIRHAPGPDLSMGCREAVAPRVGAGPITPLEAYDRLTAAEEDR
jgi:hypothetical protein